MARQYRQKARAEASAQTRRRILDAVYGLLRAEPTRAVSLERVAADADVSRSTIYLTFGSRAGLFDELARELWDRGGYQRLLEATRLPDPRETLRRGVTVGVQIYAADRDIFSALFSMDRLDPETVGGAIRRIEAQRSRGMAWLARRLDEEGALREDVSRKRAADVLWMLTSFDAFDLLYTGRNLGAGAVASRLVEVGELSLRR